MNWVLETFNPDTYVDAQGQPKWENYMDEEYESLMKNKTWELIPLP